MTNIYAELCALVFVSMFSGMAASMHGFGGAIIFHICFWSFVTFTILPETSTLYEVVVYIALSTHLIGIVQALYLRHYIIFQWKFALLYVCISFSSTFIGIQMLVSMNSIMMIRILGGVLFLSFVGNIFKDLYSKRQSKII